VSAGWVVDPNELIALLEEHGFDVEQADLSLPGGGGSLTARREMGTRALVVTTDAGGRLQIFVTEQLEDAEVEPNEIASVRLTITDTTMRRRTIRGTVGDARQFRAVIEHFAGNVESSEPPTA
jgi:hypothetical protein